MKELFRPWKLATLLIGILILIYGAYVEQLPDWDNGLSVYMALLTYLSAPWAVRAIIERRYRWWPVAAFWFWFSVDGSYMSWNGMVGHPTYRMENLACSGILYLICGFIWLHRGPLKTLLTARRGLI